METAVTTAAAEITAFFPLRDVEDLHDPDLDGVLADRLADAEIAPASTGELVGLVGRGGPTAMFAHVLGARALLLAVR